MSQQQPSAGGVARFRNWFSRFMLEPVNIDFLVYFRIIFGVVMLSWVAKYCAYGLVDAFYVEPRMHFHYYGFEWVQPWRGDGAWLEMYVLALCAVLMILGYFYRVSSVIFAVVFTHLFLLDKTLYQNHYYLVCLLSWILAVLPAEAAFSIDAWQRPAIRRRTAPAWMLNLLRFQIAVPYFFGGVAKISSDWLLGQPMGLALASKTSFPVIGPLFDEYWFVLLFAWGGLLFDLLIVPALIWKRTRVLAFVAALGFHVMNANLWTIGIFPGMMILATVIFFPHDSLTRAWVRLARRFKGKNSPDTDTTHTVTSQPAPDWQPRWTLASRVAVSLLMVYVTLQCVVPLRHLAYAGDDNWSEEGHYFSWHMLLRGKKCGIRYYARDPRTGKEGTVNLRRFITAHQATRFGRDPRMVHQLARRIREDYAAHGYPGIEVRVLALVSLNGRKPQLIIDPDIDLAAQPSTASRPDWLLPLEEPLRTTPWDKPLEEWEQHVALTMNRRAEQKSPAAP